VDADKSGQLSFDGLDYQFLYDISDPYGVPFVSGKGLDNLFATFISVPSHI
jgi:hypothetical protein